MRDNTAARIKGAAVQDFYVWYADQVGPERMRAIWDRLPPSAREELGPAASKLLAFRWYSAASIHALIDLTLEGQSEVEVQRLSREGARVIVAQTLRGLYRAIFSALVTPSRYLKSANLIWTSLHDTGSATGTELSPTHHRVEIRGWRGHHPFIESMAGYVYKNIYEAMDCRDVVFRQSHGQDERGGTTFITDIRWRR